MTNDMPPEVEALRMTLDRLIQSRRVDGTDLVDARAAKELLEAVEAVLCAARTERDEARGIARRMADANAYVRWDEAGGPHPCSHGRAVGVPCRACDLATVAGWEVGDGK